MKIGFVGLGQMGKHLAINLWKNQVDLIVYSRRPEPLVPFADQGVHTTTNVTELAEAQIIFLCLPDAQVVREFLLGKQGLSHSLRPGQVIVDTSTISYAMAQKIHAVLVEKQVAFLDAPISGMEARAKDGTLTIMCGGDKTVFERVKPYLKYMGKKILYMGQSGSGQLTKLINQLLFDINAAALAEILPVAAKLGLDCELVGQVVNSGTGRSYASEFFIPRILENHFSDGYPMQKAYKDLAGAAELAAELMLPLPVLSAATQTYQTALLKGYGEQDKGAMIQVFEALLGVEFRR